MAVRAWRADSLTGPDGLVLEEVVRQDLQRGEVRVRLGAASLNYRDLLILGGAFGPATIDNLIPLSDGAGEVIETGEDVWRVAEGDRVAVTFYRDWIGGAWAPMPDALGRGGGTQGVARQEIVVRQDEVVPVPGYLSLAEAACLPCAAVTAWTALTGGPSLLPGQSVLTHGSGGVSTFAIQFARVFGARIYATTTSPEKAAQLRALGAAQVFDSSDPDWPSKLCEVVGERDNPGVDRVVETVGGKNFAASLAACKQGAHVSLVGLQQGSPEGNDAQFFKGVSTHVVRVGSKQDFLDMTRAMAAHELRPVIDRSFAFEALQEALAYLHSGSQIGKIVLDIPGGE